MNNNVEFSEDVGICGTSRYMDPHSIFTRRVTKNENMLLLNAEFNRHFIRTTGIGVIQAEGPDLDIREANIRDAVQWFEKNLRDWVGQ